MAELRTERRGILSIGRTLLEETQTLVRQEIQLAKQEMVEKIVRDLKAAAFILVSGLVIGLAFFVFIFMEVTDFFTWLTGNHLWLGLLITWLIFTLVFAAVALIAVRRLTVPKPERTIETLREDLAWLKQQLRRSGR